MTYIMNFQNGLITSFRYRHKLFFILLTLNLAVYRKRIHGYIMRYGSDRGSGFLIQQEVLVIESRGIPRCERIAAD